jgi:beta-glucosidase
MTSADLHPGSVQHLVPLLERLTVEQKAALVQGADFWTTIPIPEIGLRAMTLSDGPAGVRGPRWDERDPSLNLPSGSALAASWDVDLAYRYGAAAASEARRKGVHVVLGPTINLHRSPLGGRHFECFSEDPELSAELGAAYVRGLQDNGVAATPKHYVANDSETDRFTVDVRVDDRALRELYLAPFERAVEAGAWTMMSAYNAVNGVTMTENDLLETPLNSEWGFDGVVISDWTAVRSLESVPAAQDLAMPGPATAWADLPSAIRDGRVDEADLDRKVLRLLLLAERVGALGDAPPIAPAPLDGRAFARHAATEGAVLLRNDGLLPLDAGSLRRVAVIGQNARDARTQGGGSATVIPEAVVSPLDGIRAALTHADVRYEIGAIVQEGVVEIPVARLTNPATGEPGVHVSFHDAGGTEIFSEERRSTALVWFGGDVPLASTTQIVVQTRYTADASRVIELGFASASPAKIYVDGSVLVDEAPVVEGTDLGAAFLSPPSATSAIEVSEGVSYDLRVVVALGPAEKAALDALSVTLGIAPERVDPDELISRAAAEAAASDVAIVVVGTNSRVESEGYDRSSLHLPGRQDDLVRAVAASGTPTIVVVNAGSPVILPWAGEVGAILQGYFGGQEFGHAVADILIGEAEPGGRLPTTWPVALTDVPVTQVAPIDGRLDYSEGLHVGYRAWLRAGVAPAFPFGHGLSYTTWSWGSAHRVGDALEVTLANTGTRAGKQVVQVYAEREDSAVERPERWLVGFAPVFADAGQTVTATIQLPARRFAHWSDGWVVEPGGYSLRVGASVEDLRLGLEWTT